MGSMKSGLKQKEFYFYEKQKIKNKQWELKIQKTVEEVLNYEYQDFFMCNKR